MYGMSGIIQKMKIYRTMELTIIFAVIVLCFICAIAIANAFEAKSKCNKLAEKIIELQNLITLNQENFDRHCNEVKPKDPDALKKEEFLKKIALNNEE